MVACAEICGKIKTEMHNLLTVNQVLREINLRCLHVSNHVSFLQLLTPTVQVYEYMSSIEYV